jgi:hypothetical protein
MVVHWLQPEMNELREKNYREFGGGHQMKKKPDILVLLAVMIGMGVLVTELAYGTISSDTRPVTIQASQTLR